MSDGAEKIVGGNVDITKRGPLKVYMLDGMDTDIFAIKRRS